MRGERERATGTQDLPAAQEGYRFHVSEFGRSDPEDMQCNAGCLTANAVELGIVTGFHYGRIARFVLEGVGCAVRTAAELRGDRIAAALPAKYAFGGKKVELQTYCRPRTERLGWTPSGHVQRALRSSRSWKKRPEYFIKPYKTRSDISVEALSEMAPDDMRKQLLDWIREEVKAPQFRQAVEAIQKSYRH